MSAVPSPNQPVNLPREVLRWIQSLDLAYSVKNVKRDFANGFLVAEIFSRYYAKEIQMHSYDNGISAKAKKDNWAQLAKVFRKVGLNDLLTDGEMHLITCVEEGAAAAFICKLYEVLTRRVVQTQVKKPTVGREPGFLKEISVNKVRKALLRNDLNEDSDIQTISRVAFNVVGEHERSLQEERIMDPQRFTTNNNRTTGGGNMPGSTMTMMQSAPSNKGSIDSDMPMPQVKVKEIQVKQLDRNVTHLRALKQIQANSSVGGINSNSNNARRGSVGGGLDSNGRAVTPSGNEYGGYNHRPESPSTPLQFGYDGGSSGGKSPKTGGVLPDNSLSFLNACIARVMGPNCHPAWSAHADPYNNFIASLDFFRGDECREVDGLISDCLIEIGNSAQMVADACTVTPKQYWKVSDLFCAVLIAAPVTSNSYGNAVASFEAVGRWVADKDSSSSLTLFTDFTLFKLSDVLHSNPQKRQGIMRLLHAFAPPDTQSHIQSIKRLQMVVPELSIFIHCLTILASIETLEIDDMLLDLYIYYANIGLGMPSPKIRAGALAMLANFVPIGEQLIVPMLPQLTQLAATETWWEIQLHLFTLCGSLLSSQAAKKGVNGSVDDMTHDSVQICNKVRDIVKVLLTRQLSSAVIKWAVVSLSYGTFLGNEFNAMFTNLLGQLNAEDRCFLLNLSGFENVPGEEHSVLNRADNAVMNSYLTNPRYLPVSSSTGSPFQLIPVTVRWDPFPIVEYIASKATTNNNSNASSAPSASNGSSAQERLTALQMQLLLSASLTVVDNARKNGDKLDNVFDAAWLQLFSSLKNHILVGLCDPECSGNAASILSTFIFFSSLREKILQDSRLIASMRLIFPISVEKGPQQDAIYICQNELENFLRICFSSGHPFNAAVHTLTSQFASSYSPQFDKAVNLKKMLKEFSSQLK